MPLDSERDALLESGRNTARHVKTVWEDFTDWIFNDNVLEVALGLVIATTFTAVVKSLVSDIILPVVSLLPFIGRNLEFKFAVLRDGANGKQGYETPQQATDDGATIMTYGAFLDKVLTFITIGFALYVMGSCYQMLSNDKVIKHKVKCHDCRKDISSAAKRCMYCTSWQDGRNDH